MFKALIEAMLKAEMGRVRSDVGGVHPAYWLNFKNIRMGLSFTSQREINFPKPYNFSIRTVPGPANTITRYSTPVQIISKSHTDFNFEKDFSYLVKKTVESGDKKNTFLVSLKFIKHIAELLHSSNTCLFLRDSREFQPSLEQTEVLPFFCGNWPLISYMLDSSEYFDDSCFHDFIKCLSNPKIIEYLNENILALENINPKDDFDLEDFVSKFVENGGGVEGDKLNEFTQSLISKYDII